MNIEATNIADSEISCTSCAANCCKLEVLLITNTGVPERFIATDNWGAQAMARRDDGWCAALSRETHLCTIYNNRPLICREFEMGDSECISERNNIR